MRAQSCGTAGALQDRRQEFSVISRDHKLCYNNIVIGGCVNALRFAEKNNYPLIVHSPEPTHKFNKNYVAGEYSRLWFLLSLRGLLPFGDKVEMMNIVDAHKINVSTKSGFLFETDYKKIYLFSDSGVQGLPSPVKPAEDLYEVIDWVDVRSGMSHDHDRIESTSDFVKRILFYPTERLDGHHPDKKDAAAISYMTEEQINDPEWGGIYVKLKVVDMMKSAGIRGQSCGSTNYALKVEMSHREVFPLSKNVYEDTPSIEFIND